MANEIIVICGIDGSGKTTNTQFIRKILHESGYDSARVQFNRLPFNYFTSFHLLKKHYLQKKIAKQNEASKSRLSEEMRQHQNIKMNRLTLVVFFGFAFRILCYWLYSIFKRRNCVQIYDRYFYDNIAGCIRRSRRENILTKLLLMIIPNPKLCFILITKENIIKKRRPWFSVDGYIIPLLRNYKELSAIIPSAILINTDMSMSEAESIIKKHVSETILKKN